MTFKEFLVEVEENSTVPHKKDIEFRLFKLIEELGEMAQSMAEQDKIRVMEERQDCFYTLALLCNAVEVDNLMFAVQYNGVFTLISKVAQLHTKELPDYKGVLHAVYRYLINGHIDYEIELDNAYERLIVG